MSTSTQARNLLSCSGIQQVSHLEDATKLFVDTLAALYRTAIDAVLRTPLPTLSLACGQIGPQDSQAHDVIPLGPLEALLRLSCCLLLLLCPASAKPMHLSSLSIAGPSLETGTRPHQAAKMTAVSKCSMSLKTPALTITASPARSCLSDKRHIHHACSGTCHSPSRQEDQTPDGWDPHDG